MFVVAAGLILALVAGLWLFQRRLIYLPRQDVPPVDRLLPGWEPVILSTSDGLQLDAWFYPPPAAAPVVLVFNGNAGNRSDRAPLGAELARSGFGALLVDYRGYGDNPGRPSEAGLALDARAAAAFVRDEARDHPTVYFGESLGAAVAIELALAEPPAALVLRSPFTSLADVAATHYPLLPVRAMLWDTYASKELIDAVRAPILVVAGSEDSIVPTGQSRALYERAREPKTLLIVPGADHNDFDLLAGAPLLTALRSFVDDAIAHGP